jgi:hypothetical protein
LAWIIFASLFGSAGYVLSLLFFSPLVTSNSFLVEPFIAQVLGFLLGLDALPGIMTVLGTFCAIAGIIFIEKGSRLRTEVDARQAVIAQRMLSPTLVHNQTILSRDEMI